MITRSLDIIIVNTRVPKVPKVQNLDVPLSGCNTECGKRPQLLNWSHFWRPTTNFPPFRSASHCYVTLCHTAMSHYVTLVINGFPR